LHPSYLRIALAGMSKVSMAHTVVQPCGPGLRDYLNSKIEELELTVRDKSLNLKRLEAQRNKLNSQGMQIFFRS
jgi:hypothetical protein